AGVIFSLYDSATKLAAEVTSDVQHFFEDARSKKGVWQNVHLFQTRIRRNIRLAESPSFGQSIFDYSPQSAGAEDYQKLSAEMIAMYAARSANSDAELRAAA